MSELTEAELEEGKADFPSPQADAGEIVKRLRKGRSANEWVSEELALNAASLIERQAAEIDNLQMVLDDTAREREEWNGKHQQACLEIERQAAEIAYWKEQATELGRTRQRNEAEIERLREALQTILDIRVALSPTGGGK